MARKIVIIGGVACGLKAASRARRLDGQAEITVIEQGEQVSWAACGMPYVVSGRIKKAANLIQRSPAYFERVRGIRMLTGCRATAIDREHKLVRCRPVKADGDELALPYDKLVLPLAAGRPSHRCPEPSCPVSSGSSGWPMPRPSIRPPAGPKGR